MCLQPYMLTCLPALLVQYANMLAVVEENLTRGSKGAPSAARIADVCICVRGEVGIAILGDN